MQSNYLPTSNSSPSTLSGRPRVSFRLTGAQSQAQPSGSEKDAKSQELPPLTVLQEREMRASRSLERKREQILQIERLHDEAYMNVYGTYNQPIIAQPDDWYIYNSDLPIDSISPRYLADSRQRMLLERRIARRQANCNVIRAEIATKLENFYNKSSEKDMPHMGGNCSEYWLLRALYCITASEKNVCSVISKVEERNTLVSDRQWTKLRIARSLRRLCWELTREFHDVTAQCSRLIELMANVDLVVRECEQRGLFEIAECLQDILREIDLYPHRHPVTAIENNETQSIRVNEHSGMRPVTIFDHSGTKPVATNAPNGTRTLRTNEYSGMLLATTNEDSGTKKSNERNSFENRQEDTKIDNKPNVASNQAESRMFVDSNKVNRSSLSALKELIVARRRFSNASTTASELLPDYSD